MSEVNIALIGYKFMGKAHSNAYRQVSHFFPGKLTPRMKVICGRDRAGAESAAKQFGWEEVETDWRKVIERKDIDVVDISTPGNLHHEMSVAAARQIGQLGRPGWLDVTVTLPVPSTVPVTVAVAVRTLNS